MTQAKYGDTVVVHYTGKLQDGTVFDTSLDREPLQFTIGDGRIIPSFEQAIVGMSPGESKTIKIPAEKAYGPHHREMVAVVDRDQFPPDAELKIGQRFKVNRTDGQTTTVLVTDVSESSVTLDANHPLAGKELIFDIQLVNIV